MPSTRPCAAFEPISPDFNVKALVESTPNFEYVVRIHCDMIDHQGIEAFEKLVLIHVILGGKPLVVEGYDGRLDRWTFAVQWLRDNMGAKVENPRDLTKKATVPMTFAHYLNHMALLTNQWTPTNYKDTERQRIYLKDIDCPPMWHDKLQNVLPSFLCYWNDTTGELGGFGAVDEPDPSGSGTRRGKGIGKSGDLMSCLPKEMRAENMMCYIGHEGTYTPSHREMCASLGHNIMVEASSGLVEDGKPTKPGSSIWFMTETKERAVVAEYWLSKLGHDIEIENHFAQVNAWKVAPFKTYVVEQKPGDFILIPPLAPHQVWNRGTRTMKVAWNRTTVETLELALNESLPNARMVCRDEQYKNKAMIYFALQKYSKLLKTADKVKQKKSGPKRKPQNDIKVRQLEKDFRRLHGLYTQVLLSENFLPLQHEKPELLPFEGFITCSYCRSNIFNRFLTCSSCKVELGAGEDPDTYDVCMDCYAMGRSCACISKLKWVEQFTWTELTQKHDQWRQQILAFDGKVTDKSPMSLKIELQRLGTRRTLAQICQMELKRRPWRDITKPPPQVEEVPAEEIELDINGNVKKTKKKARRSEKFVREHARCHIDIRWEPLWKQATCSKCEKHYCYGSLFRAYDERPEEILANPNWECPSCRHICSCRTCGKKPDYRAYTPTKTYLGNDTKRIADPRSVESLVDFSCSNIAWIQKAGDDTNDTLRLKRRRHEADAAQAQDPELGEDYADEDDRDDVEDRIIRLAQHEGIPIDPALAAAGLNSLDPVDEDEDIYEENPEGPRRNHESGRGPMLPQYVVPEGGIIRDSDHAYVVTEAITYDYPDPDMGVPVPVPADPAEPAPTGYGPAGPDSPGHDKIEMINRKRKRNKLDEGDKAFIYNKHAVKEKSKQAEKPKKRQSLIVKLPIGKEKLAEANKMAIIAQRALNGDVVAPAPLIGSDLQALNLNPGVEGQRPTKKARLDQVLVDRDDEFTPGRSRDRRRPRADGLPLPPRPDADADITRRTTRMQVATYEEPDEDEFVETLGDTPQKASKLAVMKQAIDIDSNSEEEDDDDDREDEEEAPVLDVDEIEVDTVGSSSLPAPPSSNVLPPSSRSTLPTIQDTTPARRTVVTLQPLTSSSSRPQSRAIQEPRSSTATSKSSRNDQSRALAEAKANRAAKMAAMDWMENDSEDLDDAWSEDESEASPPKKTQAAPAKDKSLTAGGDVSMTESSATASASPAPLPQRDESSAASSASKSSPPAVQIASSATSMPASSATLAKLGLTRPAMLATAQSESDLNTSITAKAPPRAKIIATTADWSDSDSDSDTPAITSNIKSVALATAARGGGWTSVNGSGGTFNSPAVGAGRGNHANVGGMRLSSSGSGFAKRGRERPPKM